MGGDDAHAVAAPVQVELRDALLEAVPGLTAAQGAKMRLELLPRPAKLDPRGFGHAWDYSTTKRIFALIASRLRRASAASLPPTSSIATRA